MMLFYILVALQVIDLASTVLALNKPGLVEGNRWLKALMDKIGVLPSLLLIKGVFIGWIYYFKSQLPEEIILILIVGYVWVCWNNLKLLHKQSG